MCINYLSVSLSTAIVFSFPAGIRCFSANLRCSPRQPWLFRRQPSLFPRHPSLFPRHPSLSPHRFPANQSVLFPAPATRTSQPQIGRDLSGSMSIGDSATGAIGGGGGGGGSGGGGGRWGGSDDASSTAGDFFGGGAGDPGFRDPSTFATAAWPLWSPSGVGGQGGGGVVAGRGEAAGGGGGGGNGAGVTVQTRLAEQPGVFWELYGSAEEGDGATTGNVVLALDILGSFDFYSIPADGGARGVGGVGVSGEVRQGLRDRDRRGVTEIFVLCVVER